MLAKKIVERVGEDAGGDEAALGKASRTAEVESEVGDGDLRDADGAVDAVADAVIAGERECVGIEGDGDAVEAEAGLIDDRRREDVDLVEGADLAVRGAVVAEAGDGVQLEVGLGAGVLLPGVVEVEGVGLGDVMEEVAGELVGLDGAGRRAGGDGGGDALCGGLRTDGEEVHDLCPGRTGRAGGEEGALRLGGDVAGEEDGLLLAKALVAEKEEGLVLEEGAAECAAEVVTIELVLARGFAIEEVAGVEVVVAEVVEGLAVDLVGAGAGGDVDDGAGGAAELGAEGGVDDLELGGGVDGGLEGDLVLRHIVEVDAVDLEVVGVFAIAGGGEGVRSEASAGCGEAAVVGRDDGAGCEVSEVEEVAAIQRDLLNGLPVDDLADGEGLGLDGGGSALDLDGGSGTLDGEPGVEGGVGVDFKRELEDGEAAEPGRGDGHRVVAGLERGGGEAARAVAGRVALGPGGDFADGHGGIGHDRAGRVGDGAGQVGGGLGREDCGARQEKEGKDAGERLQRQFQRGLLGWNSGVCVHRRDTHAIWKAHGGL